jgi:hypothetical protein
VAATGEFGAGQQGNLYISPFPLPAVYSYKQGSNVEVGNLKLILITQLIAIIILYYSNARKDVFIVLTRERKMFFRLEKPMFLLLMR